MSQPLPTEDLTSTDSPLCESVTAVAQGLDDHLKQMSQHCTQCQICVHECDFLQHHGDPKVLATSYDPKDPACHSRPFECHLCGLCAAVCPHSLDPGRLFLEMRRQAATSGYADFPQHNVLRNYEKRGTSKQFSWYSLPKNCDTIFFPGCALSGSRPEETYQSFTALKKQIPAVGIVLDCCTKPSHDLGDQNHFDTMFSEMLSFLTAHGIKNVIVACPNCQAIFTQYAQNLKTRTLYEVLDEVGEVPQHPAKSVAIHDPCVTRFQETTQKAVRSLLEKQGFSVTEPTHSGCKTLCCGEGAGVSGIAPGYSEQWAEKRLGETSDTPLVSYCAACVAKFSSRTRSYHILDLIHNPDLSLTTDQSETKAPFTYINRLKLKRRFRRESPTGAVIRERTTERQPSSRRELLAKWAFLTLLILSFIGFRAGGGLELLQPEKLQSLINGYGIWAPLAYMLLYAVAPTLFLPGLPIGIVGGLIFGPVWGVIYTISSATVGACLAFLISRYLARDLISEKLKAPQWHTLNKKVEQNGWKIVALTRLIPLFPFNLLNYAFGLTDIRFGHYCLATFVFMLPGTIAFISFSSSLPDLLRGHLTTSATVGIILISVMSVLPFLYKRIKKGRSL